MDNLAVLVRRFYALSVLAHTAHINTRSFAQHSALGSFYEKVNDFKDRLAEYLIGENRIQKIEVPILEMGDDIIKDAVAVAEMFCACSEEMEDEALSNMAGEFEEAVGKLRYLFLLK